MDLFRNDPPPCGKAPLDGVKDFTKFHFVRNGEIDWSPRIYRRVPSTEEIFAADDPQSFFATPRHFLPNFISYKYRYFDTPDGEDSLKKMGYAMKVGSLFGFGVNYMQYSFRDQFLKELVIRTRPHLPLKYLTGTLPWTFAAMLYTLTAEGLFFWRRKSDIWNHTWAGVAAALPLAQFYGPHKFLVPFVMIGATWGILQKWGHMYGYRMDIPALHFMEQRTTPMRGQSRSFFGFKEEEKGLYYLRDKEKRRDAYHSGWLMTSVPETK